MEIDQTELREYLAYRDYKLQIHMKAAKEVVEIMLKKQKDEIEKKKAEEANEPTQ